MIDVIKNGGILMIPIFASGIISTFIIIERFIYFSHIKRKDKKLMAALKNDLDHGDLECAKSDCIMAQTPCASVIKKALECSDMDEGHRKEVVQTEMDNVVPLYEHLLTALGTIANISTLLGLLGTVTGNIKAFGVLGAGGSMGDPAILANAIAEALVTTVAGLCVAIPSLIFYNYFTSQVNHRITDLESNVTKVMFKIMGKDI